MTDTPALPPGDSDADVLAAARGMVLSGIEEYAVLMMHDQAPRLRGPADYADRFIRCLLDIRACARS